MTHVCRACYSPLSFVFADLGRSPPSNAFRTREQLDQPEYTLPLRVFVCDNCKLVQMPAYEQPENIFTDYAYLSGASPTWIQHTKEFAATMTAALNLTKESLVAEVASNDGCTLQHFQDLGVPVIGVEPAENVARIATKKGVPTIVAFFGKKIAREIAASHGHADLIHAANVLAHVPNIHDFVSGFTELLAPQGIATFEFPHVGNLIKETQLDTIYHEHYSYLSLLALEPIFRSHWLRVCHVDRLSTHGGSIRLHVCHSNSRHLEDATVAILRADETYMGLNDLKTYSRFQKKAERVKRDLVQFLMDRAEANTRVVGFGAPAKATTLLNFCGIDADLVRYTVDAAMTKQGKYIPGTRIPIYAEEEFFKDRPDYVLIFPWNLTDAIIVKCTGHFEKPPVFMWAIPRLALLRA